MAIRQEPCFPDSTGSAAGSNIPSGDISATTTQDAVNELDTEKAPIASPTFTGIITSSTGRVRYAVNVETLSAGRSILTTDKQVQLLDPNGANRDVTLYASPTAGDSFTFRNSGTGGFNLVLKNNAGTTLVTIGNGVVVAVLYNGTNWILV